jgi:glycosyltransferase involved in cell wall biosynthesis
VEARQVRVLIAHNRYRFAGGEERHVELLERGLQAAGIAVRRFERDSAELEESRIRRAAAGAFLAYRPRAGGIGRALKDWKPTVVHFHNIWPLLTPSALSEAKRTGARVILTAHNYRFACPGGTLLRGATAHHDCIEGSSLRCGLRDPRGSRTESIVYGMAIELQRRLGMLGRWVDAFVAPSRFMAAMLVRSGLPRDRVHVVASGVPVPHAPPRQRPEHVLFHGRLAPEKGVATLLEAARLNSRIPLALAGSGPLASAAEAAGGNVRYLGDLDEAGLRRALSQAALTVVPSECYENLPLAALEALALGRPVVATRMGGLPEIVDDGETGRLVPPGDSPALATAIARLWEEPQLTAAMGRRAHAVAAARFTLERQTEQLIDLYASESTRL